MHNRFAQQRPAGDQESKESCNRYYLLSKPWFLIFAAVLLFTALQVNVSRFNNKNDTTSFPEPHEMKDQLHVVKQKHVVVDPFEDQAPNPQDSNEKTTMVLRLDRFNVQLNITIEPLPN